MDRFRSTNFHTSAHGHTGRKQAAPRPGLVWCPPSHPTPTHSAESSKVREARGAGEHRPLACACQRTPYRGSACTRQPLASAHKRTHALTTPVPNLPYMGMRTASRTRLKATSVAPARGAQPRSQCLCAQRLWSWRVLSSSTAALNGCCRVPLPSMAVGWQHTAHKHNHTHIPLSMLSSTAPANMWGVVA